MQVCMPGQLSYWGSCAPINCRCLLLWCVVERLALVDDVNGQKLDRLVANDLVGTVRHIPNVQANSTSRNWHLFSIWQLDGATFEEVVGFVAMVDVQHRSAAARPPIPQLPG